MKDVVKGYDNTYSKPEIVISQVFGDVIMSSNTAVPDENGTYPPGFQMGSPTGSPMG